MKARRLWILLPLDVRAEREDLYMRLRRQIERLNRILNNPDTPVEVRLKAVQVLGRLARAALTVLKDMQLDEIQSQLLELEMRVRKRR